ncbi:MAG: hypothetical protein KatS3mg010_1524 [Acidimicrobiia bacterium]|nr:MAG: hypothetical protein KatS3mg010_1524 [Acidimicrobiia bacterium]
MFIIEDWNAAHTMREAVRQALLDTTAPDHEERVARLRESMKSGVRQKPPAPLSRLGVELFLSCAGLSDAVASVTVDHFWLSVVRGPAELDAASFRLSDIYSDYFGNLPPHP